RHLVNVVHDLTSRGIGLKVVTGQGAAIDTTTPAGKLVFGIFASLAEFERDWPWLRLMSSVVSTRSITHAAPLVRNSIALFGGPMSYIKHVLQTGETVRYQGSVHWILYLPAIILGV